MARSKVYGVPKLRRTLRRLPDEITKDVKLQVRWGAAQILSQVKAGAPHPSIREALTVKTARDWLTATVGLHGKRANRKGFLVRIFEFGAKAHKIVPRGEGKRAKRRRAGGAKVAGARVLVTKEGRFLGKSVNHPGMRARPFFFATAKRLRPDVIARIKAAIGRAIEKASKG